MADRINHNVFYIVTRAGTLYGWGHIERACRIFQWLERQKTELDLMLLLIDEQDLGLKFFNSKKLQKTKVQTYEGLEELTNQLLTRPGNTLVDLLDPDDLIDHLAPIRDQLVIMSDKGVCHDGVKKIIVCNPRFVWKDYVPELMVGGLDYVVLPPELAEFESTQVGWKPTNQKIIINLGGILPPQRAARAVEFCDSLQGLLSNDQKLNRKKLVLKTGINCPHLDELTKNPGIEVSAVFDLRDYVNNTYAAINTAGYIRNELHKIGIPQALVSVADHQSFFAEKFQENNFAPFLGDFDCCNPSELAKKSLLWLRNVHPPADINKAETSGQNSPFEKILKIVLAN